MFGDNRNSTATSIGSKLFQAMRQWFNAFGGYQPNRTYMRGAGPASKSVADKSGGFDAGAAS